MTSRNAGCWPLDDRTYTGCTYSSESFTGMIWIDPCLTLDPCWFRSENSLLIAAVLLMVRYTCTGPATVRPVGISRLSRRGRASGSARAHMNDASRFWLLPFDTGTNGRRMRNSSLVWPGRRVSTYSGSIRFPDDDAFCGAFVPVDASFVTPALAGSADTSQLAVPAKKVDGSVTWYLVYMSVWDRKRSCG